MTNLIFNYRKFFLTVCFALFTSTIYAQTTEFNYQGSLRDGANVANGNYDFEFRLFAVDSGGTTIGTLQRLNVAVTNGTFSVKLDFGAQFTGANRWLEIAVKPSASGGGFQQLLPRVSISSSPYSIRSLNAATADVSTNSQQLGGVNANQFILTTDSRLSDDRNPLPNSPNYVNNTTNQQSSANFNISGTGTANIFNAATQFNIGGARIVSAAGINTFVGAGSGTNNNGNANSFFGYFAGNQNTTGINNSFFGSSAGRLNTASFNSFFGSAAGTSNTTGFNNSFFGAAAGANNTSGSYNSFFGQEAGLANTMGGDNAFFGASVGRSNTLGAGNAFFGAYSGATNTNGNENAFFGAYSGSNNTTGTDNAFFGFETGRNNSIGNDNSFFGEHSGYSNTGGSANAFFGQGAGYANTTGSFNTFIGGGVGNTTGSNNSFFGYLAGTTNTTGNNNTLLGYLSDFSSGNLIFATAIGAGAIASLSNSIFLGRPNGQDAVRIPGSVVIDGTLVVGTLGAAGSTSICLNASSRIAPCSSSLRYKTSVQSFRGGLNIVRRLRPITFNWIDGGKADVGFGAEEVNEIEPLLTTRNEKGEIEGVKYAQITTVLVNAVKEQQTQIENQQKQIDEQKEIIREQQERSDRQKSEIEKQRTELEVLKKFVCLQNPTAQFCQSKEEKP